MNTHSSLLGRIVSYAALSIFLATLYAERMDYRNLAGFAPYGSADGQGEAARFNLPKGLAVDPNGNLVVADENNDTLRRISPEGVVSTYGGEPGISGSDNGAIASAHFSFPVAVTFDSHGNLFVADYGNHRIRKITPDGVVSNFAGSGSVGTADGQGAAAQFWIPMGMTIDASDTLYVTDNGAIRSISSSGLVTTLSGQAGTTGTANGVGTAALFNAPNGLAITPSGTLLIADSGNHCIRQMTPDRTVKTFAGLIGSTGTTDGLTNIARFTAPSQMVFAPSGNLFVADSFGLRQITPDGHVTTVAGAVASAGDTNATGTLARFRSITGMAVDSTGTLFVACGNNTIRRVGTDFSVTTYAGRISPTVAAGADGQGEGARFYWPQGLKATAWGDVYLADRGDHTIRKIAQDGTVTTIAGKAPLSGSVNGVGSVARFNGPGDLAVDSSTNIYVADTFNYVIRKVTPDGTVSTFAGKVATSGNVNGALLTARFVNPTGLAFAPDGTLVVADGPGNLRRIDLIAGTVSAIPGSLSSPQMVAVAPDGTIFASCSDNRIRKVDTANVLSTFAGSGFAGFADGVGTAAKFNFPWGLAVDVGGNVFVADTANHVIRKIRPDGTVSTFAGRSLVNGDADGVGSNARFDSPWGLAFDLGGNMYVSNYAIALGAYTVKKATRAPLQIDATIAAGLPRLRLRYGDGTPPTELSKVEIQRRLSLPTAGDSIWGSTVTGVFSSGGSVYWEDSNGAGADSQFYRVVEH